jgi:hypothetical protein
MTNINKAMLDQALSTLEEKLMKDFNKKLEEKDKKMEQIKVYLESRIDDLVTNNIDLQKKIENLEKKQTNITPPFFSSLLSKTKPAEFETKVLNAISAEVKEKSSKEKKHSYFWVKKIK